jgi:hypothetical protein
MATSMGAIRFADPAVPAIRCAAGRFGRLVNLGGNMASTLGRAGSAAVGLALLAAVFAPTAEAAAAQRVPSSATANCSGVTGRNQPDGEIPAARTAGQRVNVSTPIRNTSTATRSDLTVNYQIVPLPEPNPLPPGSPAHRQRIAPTVYWRVDNGHWGTMSFVWHPATRWTAGYWLSESVRLPTFAGHATHTLQISQWFHSDSLESTYAGFLNYGALGCGDDQDELGYSTLDIAYSPIFRR